MRLRLVVSSSAQPRINSHSRAPPITPKIGGKHTRRIQKSSRKLRQLVARVVIKASVARSWHLGSYEWAKCKLQWKGMNLDAPAFCSANRAPTLSECFKNLSVQFITHVSYGSCHLKIRKLRNKDGIQWTYLPWRQCLARKVITARVEASLHEIRVHSQEVLHLERPSQWWYNKFHLIKRTCFFSMTLLICACSAEFSWLKSISTAKELVVRVAVMQSEWCLDQKYLREVRKKSCPRHFTDREKFENSQIPKSTYTGSVTRF